MSAANALLDIAKQQTETSSLVTIVFPPNIGFKSALVPILATPSGTQQAPAPRDRQLIESADAKPPVRMSTLVPLFEEMETPISERLGGSASACGEVPFVLGQYRDTISLMGSMSHSPGIEF